MRGNLFLFSPPPFFEDETSSFPLPPPEQIFFLLFFSFPRSLVLRKASSAFPLFFFSREKKVVGFVPSFFLQSLFSPPGLEIEEEMVPYFPPPPFPFPLRRRREFFTPQDSFSSHVAQLSQPELSFSSHTGQGAPDSSYLYFFLPSQTRFSFSFIIAKRIGCGCS